MKRTSTVKITLNRETVRTLALPELRRAAGGAIADPPGSAGNYCQTVYTAADGCRFATQAC